MTTTIYLDTETGPSNPLHRPHVIEWLANKTFDPGKSFVDNAKNQQAALAKTSLQATLCELHVISYAVDEAEPITLTNDQSATGERALIIDFAGQMFELLSHAHRPVEIVAFNEAFDRNVLNVAAMRHRVRLPRVVHGVGQKPWDRIWRCAMEPLKMEWKDHVSLEQACIGFGLPLSFSEAGDIKGSEVGAAIARGEIARVAHHCSTDVRRLREVWRFIRSVDEVAEQPVDEGAVRRIMAQMGPKGES
jgi:hypothetical protein